MTGVPIVSNQICYNLLWRGIEDGLVPLCIQQSVAILPWSPLQQGVLTGKFYSADDVPDGRQRTRLFSGERQFARHGEPGLEKEMFEALSRIGEVAARCGSSMAHLALAWVLDQNAVVSVLMGARNAQQVRENLACLGLLSSVPKARFAELTAATNTIKQALGNLNLDPYEAQESSRIQ